jgi:hypothetical protein
VFHFSGHCWNSDTLFFPLLDVEHLLVMAPPTWPECLIEHFVNGCVKVVDMGITVPATSDMFYRHLAEYMHSKLKVNLEKNDLAFQHFRRLWGCYQEDKQSTTLSSVCTSPEHFTFFLCL